MTSAQLWIAEHDDRWSFILLYVGGAILLSVYAGLFWVGMLMLLHMVLEYISHNIAGVPKPLAHALWETKLDIGLFLFALVIVLYSEAVMGALGLGQAARAGQAATRGAQVVTRFGIIQRSLRVFLLIVDDLTKFMLAVWRGVRNKKKKKNGTGNNEPVYHSLEEAEEHNKGGPPWRRMTKGDYGSLGFGFVCLCLIITAPLLTGFSAEGAIAEILSELRP